MESKFWFWLFDGNGLDEVEESESESELDELLTFELTFCTFLTGDLTDLFIFDVLSSLESVTLSAFIFFFVFFKSEELWLWLFVVVGLDEPEESESESELDELELLTFELTFCKFLTGDLIDLFIFDVLSSLESVTFSVFIFFFDFFKSGKLWLWLFVVVGLDESEESESELDELVYILTCELTFGKFLTGDFTDLYIFFAVVSSSELPSVITIFFFFGESTFDFLLCNIFPWPLSPEPELSSFSFNFLDFFLSGSSLSPLLTAGLFDFFLVEVVILKSLCKFRFVYNVSHKYVRRIFHLFSFHETIFYWNDFTSILL